MEREQGLRPDSGENEVALETHGEVRDIVATSEPKVLDEDAAFERVMAIGRKVMSDHHAVLAALAK